MFDRIVLVQRTRFYIPETIAALAALVAINLIFVPNSPAFIGVSPNPFWIVVLAIPLRYGRSGALFSGIAAALVFLGLYIPLVGRYGLYDDLWVLRFPILFVLVGFVLGEAKTVFNLREDYLASRLSELEGQNEKLVHENEVVKEAHRVLTAEVATKQDTITILNEITERLKSYNPDAIFEGIVTSFRENLGADEASFYKAEGENLKLAVSSGWMDYHVRPESYGFGQGLLGLSATSRQTLSVKDYVLRRRLAGGLDTDMLGDSLLAVPVVGLEDRVYGVASIEKLPLFKFTEMTIQTAKVICGLAAASLNNALAFKGMEEKQIKDATLDIFKFFYFRSRLEEELLRSSIYMIPLSAMSFSWPKLAGDPSEASQSLLQSIIAILRAKLRAFDVLAHGPDANIPLVLLLATTSGVQAEEMKKTIVHHLQEYGFANKLTDEPLEQSIRIAAYNPHTVHSAADMLAALGVN